MGNCFRDSLPYLVVIELTLYNVQYLPSMRQLSHLKLLVLGNFDKLEYMEESSAPSSYVPREDTEFVFFPSLEELRLYNMCKLKGWWRSDNARADGETSSCPAEVEGDDDDDDDDDNGDDVIVGSSVSSRNREQAATAAVTSANEVMQPFSSFLLFPSLRNLQIWNCRNLTSLPSCPHVEELRLKKVKEELSFSEKISGKITPMISCRKRSYVDEEFAQGVVSLNFKHSEEESLSTIETIKFFQSCASSLQRLTITDCRRLKRVGRGVFEHLTNLQSLEIIYCYNLTFKEEEEEEEDNGMSWKSLERLSSLNLMDLPKGIQYLTSLRDLSIMCCSNLKSLPEAIRYPHPTLYRLL